MGGLGAGAGPRDFTVQGFDPASRLGRGTNQLSEPHRRAACAQHRQRVEHAYRRGDLYDKRIRLDG